MKKTILFLFLTFSIGALSQKITLKKGGIIDSVPVHDSVSESFALYLPMNFDVSKKYPVLFVFDMKGRAKQVLSVFREAAEKKGYILAASNNTNDTLSLSDNILIANRMFSSVYGMLPIKKNRSYTAGFASGARLASLMPTVVEVIQGVVSCGSPIANVEVLSVKRRFHFVAICGTEDYNYLSVLTGKKLLNRLKFDNQVLVFEGGHEWPKSNYLEKALDFFTLRAMSKGGEDKDAEFIDGAYNSYFGEVSKMISQEKPLLAHRMLIQSSGVFNGLKPLDSLKLNLKNLKRSKLFKRKYREQNAVFFKEAFIKEDYDYYLEDDVMHYNYNNLGWWKYQMDELVKYEASASKFQRNMGKRLRGYLNALIDDTIDAVNVQMPIDEEAENFLWMIKTITDAKNATPYLKVVSNSARVEDYGTALFYVEELLKTGYTNKKELYALENTALLRITPEFNALIAKYLKEARYDVIEE